MLTVNFRYLCLHRWIRFVDCRWLSSSWKTIHSNVVLKTTVFTQGTSKYPGGYARLESLEPTQRLLLNPQFNCVANFEGQNRMNICDGFYMLQEQPSIEASQIVD